MYIHIHMHNLLQTRCAPVCVHLRGALTLREHTAHRALITLNLNH